MYWVVVVSDWAGSVVRVLGDDDTLPGGEWRYRLVTQTEEYERAQWGRG
jgi:hypothetical protein